MSFRDYILHYLYGVFAQGFNGAIASLVSAAGIDGASKFVKDVQPPNLHLLFSIFIGTFVWNCIFYFKAHPLPDNLSSITPLKSALQSVIPTKT